ncbi:MAG: hypothetical protein AB8B63_21480 [Granulosicoccus sp.]
MSTRSSVRCLLLIFTIFLKTGCSGGAPAERLPFAEDETAGAFQLSAPAAHSDQGLLEGTLNNGPARDSNISIDDRYIALNKALADVWGARDGFSNVTLTLTDGSFVSTPSVVDDQVYTLFHPADASAVLQLDMYYPGDNFLFSSFHHPGNSVPASGNAGIFSGQLAFDSNASGSLEPVEHLEIIGGQVKFDGVLPDIALRFTLYLDNGQTATGHYTGLFDFIDR